MVALQKNGGERNSSWQFFRCEGLLLFLFFCHVTDDEHIIGGGDAMTNKREGSTKNNETQLSSIPGSGGWRRLLPAGTRGVLGKFMMHAEQWWVQLLVCCRIHAPEDWSID